MSDFSTLTLADIRARRSELQRREDVVSFVRRLAQGRIDLVRDEQRRRVSGAPADSRDLASRLADVFGQQQGGGSARPPRETIVPTDDPLSAQLDELCAEFNFEDLDSLSNSSLSALESALSLFEQSCSRDRHELFEQIDALTAELVRRLKEGGAGAVLENR